VTVIIYLTLHTLDELTWNDTSGRTPSSEMDMQLTRKYSTV